MTTKKVFSVIVAALLMISSSTFANHYDTADSAPEWKNEIISYLNGLDASNAAQVNGKIYVDFMITEKGEILVLSTSEKGLDNAIKSKLNYRKITAENLEFNKKYTIGISLK